MGTLNITFRATGKGKVICDRVYADGTPTDPVEYTKTGRQPYLPALGKTTRESYMTAALAEWGAVPVSAHDPMFPR